MAWLIGSTTASVQPPRGLKNTRTCSMSLSITLNAPPCTAKTIMPENSGMNATNRLLRIANLFFFTQRHAHDQEIHPHRSGTHCQRNQLAREELLGNYHKFITAKRKGATANAVTPRFDWCPQGDLNPRYRRERAVSWARLDDGDFFKLQISDCGLRIYLNQKIPTHNSHNL